MKAVVPHLNLLRADERLSASPVRLRVMLPVLSAFACVGLIVWWAVLGLQTLMTKSAIAALTSDLETKRSAHGEILKLMAEAREKNLVLEQFGFYAAGRRAYGPLLSRLADVCPEDVQLLSLAVPEQPAQDLADPRGPKFPKLLGPANPCEPASLRVTGRTTKAAPVNAFMRSLRAPAFTNLLVVVAQPDAYPKIHAFRQETAGDESERLLQFDFEFTCADRRFAP